MPSVFVRADANGRIGWGHVVRAGAVAEALLRAGRSVTWLDLDSDDAARTRLRKIFPVTRLRGEIVLRGRARMPVAPAPGDWILLDRYGWTAEDHEALRAAGWRVAAVDDEGRARVAADLVVNPNAGAEALTYRRPRTTRVLAGARFALLRREFRGRSPRRRTTPEIARRLLVSFGGADPLGVSARVTRLVRAAAPRIRVTVVLGPSASPATFGPSVRVVRGASAARMRSLMEEADAAVIAPSSTWAELAYLGVPAAVLAYADNQRAVGDRLGKLGLAENLGRHDRLADGALGDRLAEFLRNPARRRAFSRAGRRAVDGRGVDRVIEAMR